MRLLGSSEARAHFSELLAAVEAGATVTITRREKAVAQLVPVRGGDARRMAALRRLRKIGAGTEMSLGEILSTRDEDRR